MSALTPFYGSYVGKKIVMAASGIALFGFVLIHMLGNLKLYQGEEKLNAYAAWLRDAGAPLLPHEGALWIFRILLLAAVGLHVLSAYQVTRISQKARPVSYKSRDTIQATYASRTMRWGGVILILFLVYHILHFTTGQAHASFVPGAVHENYVRAFQSPLVYGVYLLAQVALCFHLYHGVWSFFQPLVLIHPKYNHMRRPFAVALAVVVFVGFLTPPTLVLAGVVS